MPSTFKVIIKRKDYFSLGEEIIIPDLGFRWRLDAMDLTQMRKVGAYHFSKNIITALLHLRDDERKPINMPKKLDSFLQSFVQEDEKEKITFNEKLDVTVNFRSKNHCHFFERSTHFIYKFTVLAETTATTIKDIGFFVSGNSFIPMNAEIERNVSISVSLVSTVLSLWLSFSDPGTELLRDTGASLDHFFHDIWRRLTCNRYEEKDSEENYCLWKYVKIKIVKIFFLLLMASFIYNDINQDYQQINELKNPEAENIRIPFWLYSAAAWTEFSFNQLNDPIEIITFVTLGLTMIQGYFSEKKLQNEPDDLEEKMSEAEEQRQIRKRFLQDALQEVKIEKNNNSLVGYRENHLHSSSKKKVKDDIVLKPLIDHKERLLTI